MAESYLHSNGLKIENCEHEERSSISVYTVQSTRQCSILDFELEDLRLE